MDCMRNLACDIAPGYWKLNLSILTPNHVSTRIKSSFKSSLGKVLFSRSDLQNFPSSLSQICPPPFFPIKNLEIIIINFLFNDLVPVIF